jgi:hypothetical protein
MASAKKNKKGPQKPQKSNKPQRRLKRQGSSHGESERVNEQRPNYLIRFWQRFGSVYLSLFFSLLSRPRRSFLQNCQLLTILLPHWRSCVSVYISLFLTLLNVQFQLILQFSEVWILHNSRETIISHLFTTLSTILLFICTRVLLSST